MNAVYVTCLMANTMLNDLASAFVVVIICDKRGADRLIYKWVEKREDEDRIINLYTCALLAVEKE